MGKQMLRRPSSPIPACCRMPYTASARITCPHSTSRTAGWVRISEFSSREESIGGEQLRISDRVAAISAD